MVNRLFFAILIFFMSVNAFSQRSLIYSEPDNTYRIAEELFNKQKYGQAEIYFNKFLESTTQLSSAMRINADYYAAICAVELYHENAEYLLQNFIRRYPESPKVKLAYFQLGKYYYRKKKSDQVIESMEKVDKEMLTEAEVNEYNFKLGYSNFATNNFAKAKGLLYDVKDKETPFKPSATYYYSHIAYQEANYEIALSGFQKLSSDATFGAIVPYYIVQIYYLQNKYEKVIEYAPALLDSSNVKRSAEITRILGESYYNLGKYGEAIPYLEKFMSASGIPTKQDFYQMAFANYKISNYDKAIVNFSKCINDADSLCQNSFYLLGDCYLKINQKKYAKNAFQEAAKMKFDKNIQEDALFNFAKITYDISFNPYNEAINAFQLYLKTYPNSSNKTEAYNYLVNLYLTTNNYKDALESIEKIEIKNEKMKAAYQQITFNRGVELFNGKDLKTAIPLFEKSGSFAYNKTIQSLSFYWLAEANYRMKNYDKAISNYKSFLFTPGAVNLPQFDLANYNVGYSLFNQNNYVEAITWFRKYLKEPENEKSVRIYDAAMRIGDCYFMAKDFEIAYEYYGKALKENFVDYDYALYQKSLAAGLLNKENEKIELLSTLTSKFPKSAYIVYAKYELAQSYQNQSDNDKALAIYDDVVKNNPQSDLIKSVLSKKGMAEYNKKDFNAALETFKLVIERFPKSDEATGALNMIKNISVDINNPDVAISTVKSLTNQDVALNVQDSIIYQAAFGQYTDGNCESAVKGFEGYVEKFKNGLFALSANFYKSECEYKLENYDKAIVGYDFVISQPKSEFTETALIKGIQINWDKGNFDKAYEKYVLLEKNAEDKTNIIIARIGQMRTAFKINKYQLAIEASKKVLSSQKVSKEQEEEARITIAKSAFAMDSLNMAMSEFRYIAKNYQTITGAEAKYNVSLILFKKGLYDETEKTIFELINQVPSYDYWVAKAFILLADNYVKIGNSFQAKHTLKSVIENYDGDQAVINEAQNKLDAILLSEKQAKEAEQKKAEEEKQKMQLMNTVKFQINTSEQQNLFNDLEELTPKPVTQPPVNNVQPTTTPSNENNNTNKEGGNNVK